MCEHKETKTIFIEKGPHKAKSVCVNCNKFMAWISTKTPEQREIGIRKLLGLPEDIIDYYKNHPEKDKYKIEYEFED